MRFRLSAIFFYRMEKKGGGFYNRERKTGSVSSVLMESLMRRREETMLKRLFTALVSILMVLAMMLPALAEEDLIISGRVNAELYADQAMEQHYGITLLLQEYFTRTVEEKEDYVFIVRYEGLENYAYVLGRYEVTVDDRDQVAGITWSHDGEDLSGGFDAEAWGAEQIMEMLRLNQETGGTGSFDARVEEINEKHGFYYAPVVQSDEEQEEILNEEEQESEEARKLASLSTDEMTAIAKRAVASLYGLPPEREQALENIVDEEDQPLWFSMYEGEPCYTVCLVLDDKEDDDVLPNGVVYTEKEGNYWVTVSVQTGVIEEVSYSAAIGGNG